MAGNHGRRKISQKGSPVAPLFLLLFVRTLTKPRLFHRGQPRQRRNYTSHTAHTTQPEHSWVSCSASSRIETKRSHYHPNIYQFNIWPHSTMGLCGPQRHKYCGYGRVLFGVTFTQLCAVLCGFVVIQMIIISLFTPEIKSSRTSYFKRRFTHSLDHPNPTLCLIMLIN